MPQTGYGHRTEKGCAVQTNIWLHPIHFAQFHIVQILSFAGFTRAKKKDCRENWLKPLN